MIKNIFQSVKVITLALILSLGISYVSAWTAPTATPPSGNTSAPVNVSVNEQTKVGALSVQDLFDSSDPSHTYFLNLDGDSKLKTVYATVDVCLFGTSTCLSTVSGTPGATGATGAAGATGATGPQGPAGAVAGCPFSRIDTNSSFSSYPGGSCWGGASWGGATGQTGVCTGVLTPRYMMRNSYGDGNGNTVIDESFICTN